MNLRKYWEERISKYGLLGAGDLSLHPKINEIVKKLKIRDIKSMVNFSGKRVLDAGCGTGLYSKLAKEMGAREVIGLDKVIFILSFQEIKPEKENYQQSYKKIYKKIKFKIVTGYNSGNNNQR